MLISQQNAVVVVMAADGKKHCISKCQIFEISFHWLKYRMDE